MPEPAGGCATFGAIVSGMPLKAQTTLKLDESYGLGDVGAVGGSGGMVRAVEIDFK
jgi:hypothetical protein